MTITCGIQPTDVVTTVKNFNLGDPVTHCDQEDELEFLVLFAISCIITCMKLLP